MGNNMLDFFARMTPGTPGVRSLGSRKDERVTIR